MNFEYVNIFSIRTLLVGFLLLNVALAGVDDDKYLEDKKSNW